MNAFQSIQSGSGLLQDAYQFQPSTQLEALKRRRDKLTDKIDVPSKDKAELQPNPEADDNG
jgi:hypothetical protein